MGNPATSYTIDAVNNWPIVIPAASTMAAGVMSAADKIKLDSLTPGGAGTLATVYAGGTVAADQTMLLSDVNGGGVRIWDNAVPITGPLFEIASAAGATTYLQVAPTGGGDSQLSASVPIHIVPPNTISGIVFTDGSGPDYGNVTAGGFVAIKQDVSFGGEVAVHGGTTDSTFLYLYGGNADGEAYVQWFNPAFAADVRLQRTGTSTVTLDNAGGGAAVLTVPRTGTTALLEQLILVNATASTGGATEHYSGTMTLQGTAWDGAASQSLSVRLTNQPDNDYVGAGGGQFNPVLAITVNPGDGSDQTLLKIYPHPTNFTDAVLDANTTNLVVRGIGFEFLDTNNSVGVSADQPVLQIGGNVLTFTSYPYATGGTPTVDSPMLTLTGSYFSGSLKGYAFSLINDVTAITPASKLSFRFGDPSVSVVETASLSSAGVFNAFGYSTTMQAVTSSGAITVNPALGAMYRLLANGNVTGITISAASAGQTMTLVLVQNAAGTATWPVTITNARLIGGVIAKTLTANAVDAYTFRYNTTDAKWDQIATAVNIS